MQPSPHPNQAEPPSHPPCVEDCFFYHSVDLGPNLRVEGQWDLEPHLDNYWSGSNFAEQSVLEIGPASGFLAAQLEQRGALVTSLELADGADWDVVRYQSWDADEFEKRRAELQQRLLGSYWLTHSSLQLRARLLLGSVYNIPATVGDFDISTICAVLLHLRQPMNALEQVARRTRHRMVLAEPLPGECLDGDTVQMLHEANRTGDGTELAKRLQSLNREQLFDPAAFFFRPDFRTEMPKETWWSFAPAALEAWLGVLGFEADNFRLYLLEHDSTYAFHKPKGHIDRKTFHPYWSMSLVRRH